MVTGEANFMPPAERLFRRCRHGRGVPSGRPVGRWHFGRAVQQAGVMDARSREASYG